VLIHKEWCAPTILCCALWQRVLDMPLLLRRMGRDLLDPNRALHLLHNVRFAVCVSGLSS